MRKLLTAAAVAAATTWASWAMKRWLDERYARIEQKPMRKPVESWENEGGAVSPAYVAVETSQVPR